ncbi:hypothetical protein EsH8_V_000121 [Colletotrichum jinshuiense]
MSTTAAAAATPTPTGARAPSQGGIFEGMNPTVFNPADPIVMFIIQAVIVISLTRLLYWPLSLIREPKVIAEVIAGILLGPSVFGRIPGFTAAIFPKESMAPFRLAANLGLVLFLFLVGLEINLSYLLSNWRTAISVATLDMAIPFGLGVALAYGLYTEFHDDPGLAPISFGVFALFIGVAIAITAFPVLCRILTSLKLLNTTVGVIVLTSGITNDVVGWVLLALCVTLVNAGAGVTAVWILLVSVGYSLFLAYAVRPAFMWVLRRTKSLEHGPSQGVVCLTIMMVLASAFFTSVIGVHSIFGAFMVGLMCPHEGGFAIKLTEKIEDLIATLFVPLFFALSGINTNLGLLNNGKTWGYVIAIIFVAFFSKVIGGTAGARMNGLVWRESFTIGTLMSCKGLVELIVLNIGLQAKILSTRTFTMFVVMALVTTFATTPLVMWLYPPSYQQKLELWKRGKINWDGTPIVQHGADHEDEHDQKEPVTKLLVYLRTDGLSSLLSTISLFTSGQGLANSRSSSLDKPVHRSGEKGLVEHAVQIPDDDAPPQELLRIHGCRLVGLTERNSSVMKVSEIEEYAGHDPIIKAFGTSANNTTRDVVVSGQIAVVPEDSFADTLATQANKLSSDLILVPWSETGTISELPSFYSATTRGDPISTGDFPVLMSNVFDEARHISAVATYIDATLLEKTNKLDSGTKKPRQLTRHVSGVSVSEHQDPSAARFFSAERRGKKLIRVLYTGTEDDIYAVKLGIQLAQNENLEVNIVDAADPDAEANMQFAQIKSKIHETVASRVSFNKVTVKKDTTTSGIVSELLALQAGEKRPTTYILGRSGVQPASQGTAGDSSTVDPRKTLGSVAAEIVSEITRVGVANRSTTPSRFMKAQFLPPTIKQSCKITSADGLFQVQQADRYSDLSSRGPRKEHLLAKVGRLAYDIDTEASMVSPPSPARTPLLECFQVAQPVIQQPGGESATVTLMEHQFAHSYGAPFVGSYTPPDFDFDHVVINFTVEVKGRQFDRWGSVYLGDINIFSTSTAEPTPNGITWTWLKDVTPYLSLWKEPQTLIFQLDNVITDVYTGLLNSTLTATFFKSPIQSGGQAPADLILPVSARKSPATASFWTYPEEDASISLQFPRNVNRAVFSVSVKAQGNDEFWWSNVPLSAVTSFQPDVGTYPGYSPFREVQVLIDGQLAGVHWPYPVIFTGGVVPQLHRPIVGIDAFDLRDHEIDVSPWLPLLCDGNNHTFSIKVVGLVDDGVASASLSNTTEGSWYLVGKVFLWLDEEGSVTTGALGTTVNQDPAVDFSQSLTQNATGFNSSLDYTVTVQRSFSITSQLSTQKGNGTATWTQSLLYSNVGGLFLNGYGGVNKFSTAGQETARVPGWDYETSFSYPLFCNTTATYLPEGNLTLWAQLDQGLKLEVQGNTVYPTGLEAFERDGTEWVGSVIDTDRNGTANYSRYGDNTVTSGIGDAHQIFRFSGLTGDDAHGKGTQLYFRDVTAYNNTVVADHEVGSG